MNTQNSPVYGRGRNQYRVTLENIRPDFRGGYSKTLVVRADSWRGAKHYVETMDPARVWVDYGRVLREGGEPEVIRVADNKREYLNRCLWLA